MKKLSMKQAGVAALFVATFFVPNSYSESYRKLMECEDGNFILDVDLDSPRSYQVIIKDQRVMSYFEQVGGLKVLRGNGPLNPDYRLILNGSQDQRLTDVGFKGSKVRVMEKNSPYRLAEGFGPFQRHFFGLTIYPQSGGVLLRLDEDIGAVDHLCAGRLEYSGEAPVCRGQYVSYPAESFPNRANWFFQGCRTF